MLGQLRWDPSPLPSRTLSFVEGLATITTAGDSDTQVGMAAHVAMVTRSMENEYVFNSDGELLVVASTVACASAPNSASSRSSPAKSASSARDHLQLRTRRRAGRAYVCENYGGAFTLPDRGPIGANCLANARDF